MFFSLILILVVIATGYYFLFGHERLKAPSWNLQSNSITIEGIERTFDFYVPKNLAGVPSLIFLLHGSDGSSQLMRYLTNYEFEKQSEHRNNFIVVYPQGFEKYWNDCRKSASYIANTSNINEIEFFKKMIEFFSENYKIDKNKVFSVGYSNGGQMCYKLALEIPELIKGIGVYSANLPVQANNDCNSGDLPVSTIIINGTSDPINPFEGGLVVLEGDSSRGRVLSSINTFNYFKSLLPDTCKNQEIFQKEYSEMVFSKEIKCSYSGHCIELVTVKEAGHTIPLTSIPPYLPSRIGKTEMSINSVEIILNFFEDIK